MQATLSAAALKPFVRALSCLSRYGDDLVLYADAEHVTLSATNSSLSAYCRFRYGKMFFSRYRVGSGVNGAPPSGGSLPTELQDVKGQLPVKTLLSIFKHRTIEKTVERCELVVIEGPSDDQPQEDEDSLESRLVVRLQCKHGVVKTHRLPLLIPTSLLSPGVPESDNESRLTIGPRAIRDITEHFPSGRGTKSDPQLVWTFGETDVEVKSLESSIDTKGRAQLATELTISADEFDVYEIADSITVAFHLREFNATITYAESMATALELRFTDPAAPLFIDVEGDESDGLFVISTSHLQGTASNPNTNTRSSSTPNPLQPDRQRGSRSDNEAQRSSNASVLGRKSETPRIEKVKKTMKAVHRTEIPARTIVSRESSTLIKDEHMMPPPSSIPDPRRSQGIHSAGFPASQDGDIGAMGDFNVGDEPGPIDDSMKDSDTDREPLFYPQPSQTQRAKTPLFFPLSQLSQQDEQVIRESGLGVEYMNEAEFEAMLEGEGEEVNFVAARSMESVPDSGDEFGPTQDRDECSSGKAFQPLFDD